MTESASNSESPHVTPINRYFSTARKKSESCKHSIPNELLQLQLHTKHLFTNTERNSNELIQMCIEKIQESIFDGLAFKILDIIIENAKENELKQMHEIVKNIKLQNDAQNDIQSEDTSSLFCQLPVECISHICSHLSRNDIKSLKQTCYDIGVVCLDHMTKHSVGICNFNKFLQYPQLYLNIKSFDDTLMNQNYYHPSTLLGNLFEQWQIDYCIPKQFVFMYSFHQTRYNNRSTIRPYKKLINITAAFSKNNKNCFLFDTRNMVYLGSNESIPIVWHKTQNVTGFGENNLLVVQYFDIETQCIQMLQPLLIHQSVTVKTILEYIENTFIATTIKQRVWYNKFKKILAENNELSACLFEENMKLPTRARIYLRPIVKPKITMVILAYAWPGTIPSSLVGEYKEMDRDVVMFKTENNKNEESFDWTEESSYESNDDDDDDDSQIWQLERGFSASSDDNEIDEDNDHNNNIL